MTPEGTQLRDALGREAAAVDNPRWRPMLQYLAQLHGESIRPRTAHFPYPYQAIGPGYEGGTPFGHIDLAHERLDTVAALPIHVRNQTRNELAGQQRDGLIPGVVYPDSGGNARWKDFKGFPPFWPVAVEAYVEASGDTTFLAECLAALERQIAWFEKNRATDDGGFYYLDATTGPWESGVDEGVRYDARPPRVAACVDATSHVYWLYDHADRWSQRLGRPASAWRSRRERLRRLIVEQLFDAETGFFYDRWKLVDQHHAAPHEVRHLTFEGMWPVVVGAASEEQAVRVIDEHLLNPREFFARHPIATVALSDAKYEPRMWRGPAWNSMTYWAARGCYRYGRRDAAAKILAAALDATAAQFERSGTIWEFYDPRGGPPEKLFRKSKGRSIPCRDYVGHNPLFAMARLWAECRAPGEKAR